MARKLHVHGLIARCLDASLTMEAPRWQALPVETRRSVTKLMVRLIPDHIGGDRAGRQEGADHDA
ncbi:MAG: hypothetical protein E5Y51_10610 [Mesorhizobium sp.]|nr:MAG: hypothetical protein E5Y51_10610 [Mesorhizobium sp.]